MCIFEAERHDFPRLIWVAGRRALVTGHWDDEGRSGLYYTLLDTGKAHWIGDSDFRLGMREAVA